MVDGLSDKDRMDRTDPMVKLMVQILGQKLVTRNVSFDSITN